MPLPTLTMRTVIQSLATYPKMASFVMVIMSCLISKQVWKHRKVWEGFVKCCQRIKPQSFSLLLQLPPPQLKDAFSICPDLQEPLLSHVVSFPAHQRAHVHKSIMSVLESLPEKSVFSEVGGELFLAFYYDTQLIFVVYIYYYILYRFVIIMSITFLWFAYSISHFQHYEHGSTSHHCFVISTHCT